jgi:hypothetical protein
MITDLKFQIAPESSYAHRPEGAGGTTDQRTLRVKNWGGLFENNRSREIKRLDYVLVPNRMDTDGYTTLLDHPNGAAHLGAWLAILQIASRCRERGVLANGDGRPHDPRSLSRISRIPAVIFEEVIPRLLSDELQWLEHDGETPQGDAGKSQEGAGFPQEGAGPTRVRDRVLIPVEVSGKGGVGGKPETPHEPPAATPEQTRGAFDELQQIYEAGGLPIAEKHQQLILQYLVGMPRGKLERLMNYVKWAFATGRWPTAAKTKALLQLIRDGDWDVELTPRVLPQVLLSRLPSKAQEAQDIAASRVRQKYGATV